MLLRGFCVAWQKLGRDEHTILISSASWLDLPTHSSVSKSCVIAFSILRLLVVTAYISDEISLLPGPNSDGTALGCFLNGEKGGGK